MSSNLHAHDHGRGRVILRELPYLAVLLFVVIGVGYTSMTHTTIAGYWIFVAVFNCGASIFAGWHYARSRNERRRLVGTQLLHWAAFLAVMGLAFLPSVQAVADANATGIIVMLLLALGTFVAGVHAMSWRMALNGAILALFVPAGAWLEQSALLVSIAAIVICVLAGASFVWLRMRA